MPFPRTVEPEKVSALRTRGALSSVTQFGNVQLRGTTARGFEWDETWRTLRSGDPDTEELLAFIRNAWNRGQTFDIQLLRTPGSFIDPNGTGSGGVTVDGGGQTGSSLNTTGWPISTNNVVMPGDVIEIAGISHIFQITSAANSDASGNATININPSIYSGNAPGDGASITTTGVTLSAYIASVSVPSTVDGFNYGDFTLTFAEAF